jgi:CheY-like chemotaxis protein
VKRVLRERPAVKLLTSIQGSLGLDLAREHQPDAILLDLHLPDMHGYEVLRRLQDDPATRHIPTVVVSADATRVQIDRLLDAGAYAYLTKPLDVPHFLATVDTILAVDRAPSLPLNCQGGA